MMDKLVITIKDVCQGVGGLDPTVRQLSTFHGGDLIIDLEN